MGKSKRIKKQRKKGQQKPSIPFSLELEAIYRKRLKVFLSDEVRFPLPSHPLETIERKHGLGIFINMAIYDLIGHIQQEGYNFIEENRDCIEGLTNSPDMYAFAIDSWFETGGLHRAYRLLIEQRELQLTGKVSTLENFLKAQEKEETEFINRAKEITKTFDNT